MPRSPESSRAYYLKNRATILVARKAYYEANKEKQAASCKRWQQTHKPLVREYHKRSRRKMLARVHGVSVSQLTALEQRQGGVCAICKLAPSYQLAVDHCHTTGRIRGLLCKPCNVGLGVYRDDSHRLRRAAAYLEGAAA